jgi:hypothetical protein
MSLRWICALVFFGLLCTAGCQQKMPPNPTLYKVTGKVVLPDGNPLDSATVQLKPKTAGKGMYCEGRTKKDGTFSIWTFGTNGEGVVPGTYLVAIHPPDLANSKKVPNVPDKYKDASTSEIIFDVKSGDNDMGTIALKE